MSSSFYIRPPKSTRPAPASSALPTVILYALPPHVMADCERAARELKVGQMEVKHLHAACTALKAHPTSFVVASSAIRPWDREVLIDQTTQLGVPVRWVDGEAQTGDVSDALTTWASETLRRSRAMR